jgi:hypothetical protein
MKVYLIIQDILNVFRLQHWNLLYKQSTECIINSNLVHLMLFWCKLLIT